MFNRKHLKFNHDSVPEGHKHLYMPLKVLKDILQRNIKLKEIDLDEDAIRVGLYNLYYMSFVIYEYCYLTNQKSKSCELRILLVDILNKALLDDVCNFSDNDMSLIISFISQISKHLTLGTDLHIEELNKSFYLGFLDMEIHKYFVGMSLWSNKFRTKKALIVLNKCLVIGEDAITFYKNSYLIASAITS